jgi:hypothetical protein
VGEQVAYVLDEGFGEYEFVAREFGVSVVAECVVDEDDFPDWRNPRA